MRAFNKKDYHTALNLFIQATEEDPSNHKAWNALGVTLVKTHSYEEADTCFKTAIELSPGNAVYIRNQLANREKLPKERSVLKIIRSEVSYINHIIRTQRSGYLAVTTLIACIIFALLYLLTSVVIIGIQPSTTQYFAFGSLGTGISFILIIYGKRFGRSLSSLPGVGLVTIFILGVVIVGFLLLNPSYLPLGNTNNPTIPEPSPPFNVTPPNPFPLPAVELESPNGKNQSIPDSPDCMKPAPSLTYTINEYDPFRVTFQEISSGTSPITHRTWSFGDGTSSDMAFVTHMYQGQPTRYVINYSAINDCGRTNSSLIIDPLCGEILTDIESIPAGSSHSSIWFIDNSTPQTEIQSWRWIFGDGESFVTTDPKKRNITHMYQKMGMYSASLMVENRCNQTFTSTTQVSVKDPILIMGRVWEDSNADGAINPAESGLPNRTIHLDEYLDDTWQTTQTTRTNTTGWYQIPISTSGGTYRVREIVPDATWKVTNPSNSYIENSSPIFSSAHTQKFQYDFGNIHLRTDKKYQISLHSSRGGTIEAGGYQSWITAGQGGLISVNQKQERLSDADRGMISILSNSTNGTILINGSSHAYFGLNTSVMIRNTSRMSNGVISAIIPTSVSYGSTVHVTLPPQKNTYTNLVVNGKPVPVNWRQEVDIYDLVPAPGPNMLLKVSENETIFIGQASEYAVR